MSLARRRAMLRAVASGGAPAWTSTDLPNRLGHLIAGTGMTLAGSIVTGWADQSPSPKAVTFTASPLYDAADVDLNGRPSVQVSGRIEIAVDRADIALMAAVLYVPSTTAAYGWDGAVSGASRVYCYCTTSVIANAFPSGTTTLATGIYSGGGRRRLIVPYDGTTASRIDGVSRGTMTANVSSGTGMAVGSSFVPGSASTVSEWIALGPGYTAGDLDNLQAYWEGIYA